MTRIEENREFLKEAFLEAKEAGMKCYLCKNPDYCYGYIVTENDNVLCVG